MGACVHSLILAPPLSSFSSLSSKNPLAYLFSGLYYPIFILYLFHFYLPLSDCFSDYTYLFVEAFLSSISADNHPIENLYSLPSSNPPILFLLEFHL